MQEPHAPTPHRQAWDLIPWVVAGGASEADQALVQQHAAACADCREELAFHRRLQQGMHAGMPAPHSPEPAWQRLVARLDEAQAETAASPVPNPAARAGRAGPRWLAAAVVAQAIGLAALSSLLLQRGPGHEGDFHTLSTAQPTPATLRLVPAPAMPVGRLAALLSANGLQIVESSRDGTVLGLAPVPGVAAGAVGAGQMAVRLRAEPGVLLAEPAGGGQGAGL